MDAEQVRLLVEQAVRAATADNHRQVASLRRPDLPPFDKDHIELWIRRVEGAYIRSGITDPKAKFAFLDKVFNASIDPIINRFLLGDQDATQWTAFLAYLRKQHGRTKRVQAHSVIHGTPREGRKPSALAAVMIEKMGDITLDDVCKEQLLKELPADVQRDMASKIKDLTFQQTADLADDYFDVNGKLLHPSTSSSNVSSIHRPQQQQPRAAEAQEPAEFTSAFPFDDDSADINAVRFKQGQKQKFTIQNRSTSRGRSAFPGSGPRNHNSNSRFAHSNNAQSSSSFNSNQNTKGNLCKYHNLYGKEARSCEQSCMMWSQHPLSKGKASQQSA